MSYNHIMDMLRNEQLGDVSYRINVDDLLTRYHLFPNEAVYLVDYKTAQVELLTKNFEKIAGVAVHQNDPTILYEHVHKDSLAPFLRHIERLIDRGLGRSHYWETEKDFNLTLYKTVKERVILKSTAILSHDARGRTRHSVGKLMDVTGLVPYQQFAYKFAGPNSERISIEFEDLNEFDHILSKRELEILKMIGLGMSSAQVAERIHVSRHTVDTHRRNIIRKLEAANSIDAFQKANSLGLYQVK